MNFFLYSGEANSGKTTAIYHMYQYLAFNDYYIVFTNKHPRWNGKKRPIIYCHKTNVYVDKEYNNHNVHQHQQRLLKDKKCFDLVEMSCVLSNGTRSLILHSTSDLPADIDALIALRDGFNEYNNTLIRKLPEIDTVISTIRSPYPKASDADPRKYFLEKIRPYEVENYCFEHPLGKIDISDHSMGTAKLWYRSQVHAGAIHILSMKPFSL